MPDVAFYNAGTEPVRGVRRLAVLARRGLRRILRPIFVHLAEHLRVLYEQLDALDARERSVREDVEDLKARNEDLADRARDTLAFGWDYAATVRRLAALEDRVEELTAQLEKSRAVLRAFDPADRRAEAG